MMQVRGMNYARFAICVVIGLATKVTPAAETEKELRVVTAQIPVTSDMAANAAAIHRALDVAIRDGADILLTPEGSVSGYTPTFDHAEVERQLAAIRERANAAGLALALGTCYVESDDDKCYNEIPANSRTSSVISTQSPTWN